LYACNQRLKQLMPEARMALFCRPKIAYFRASFSQHIASYAIILIRFAADFQTTERNVSLGTLSP
jgi:hypothetical protein